MYPKFYKGQKNSSIEDEKFIVHSIIKDREDRLYYIIEDEEINEQHIVKKDTVDAWIDESVEITKEEYLTISKQ